MKDYQQSFRTTITSIGTLSAPGNGGFLYNCEVHCGEQSSDGFNKFAVPRMNGGDERTLTAADAWWASDESAAGRTHIYRTVHSDGAHPCNPTC